MKLRIKKSDKKDAGYVYVEGSNYTCEECYFYKEKKCALYGKEVEIKPYGGCNLWQESNGKHEQNWIGSTNKTETDYVEHEGGFSCGKCEYFNSGSCKKVKGEIDEDACCNFWEEDDDNDD